jgi:hypothetical protein
VILAAIDVVAKLVVLAEVERVRLAAILEVEASDATAVDFCIRTGSLDPVEVVVAAASTVRIR